LRKRSARGHDGYKRKRGSKVHIAVDTLGHLLTVHVTLANEQERAQVATGNTVKVALQIKDTRAKIPRRRHSMKASNCR
jgi:extradiol dioxygenase family protein